MPVELKEVPKEVSSNVEAYGYDVGQRVLAVRFRTSETIYHYQDVPPEDAAGLDSAQSMSGYINAFIKPNYRFIKVEPQDPVQ